MSFTTKALVSLLTFSAISMYAHSAKPMNETDLSSVSAVTGENILNLFGAPAAGLSIDQAEPLATSSKKVALSEDEIYQESSTTEIFAEAELESLEKSSSKQAPPSNLDIDISAFEEAIYASEKTIGVATSLNSSNSEIRYSNNKVHHDLTVTTGNDIKVSRDLHIDLLKVDDLRTSAEGPSAGSIYLSDWRSKGTTHIVTR